MKLEGLIFGYSEAKQEPHSSEDEFPSVLLDFSYGGTRSGFSHLMKYKF